MELYNEEYQKNTKKSKIPLLLGISTVILIIILIAIIGLIIYLRRSITTITIDGVRTSELEQILMFDETGRIYIPIRKIAKYFNYEDYSGDYKIKSEDTTKCYVSNENEIAMFTLDSDTIIKTRGGADYEYVKIDEKVFQQNGDLYTTIDGIEKAFNIEFDYNQERKNISIYTLDYLLSSYTTNLGITNYSQNFSDKKAVLDGMLVVQANQTQYGVIDIASGNYILEPKYESISYLPTTKDFLVRSNGKLGVLSKEARNKINIAYDDIQIMDNQNGLYLVKQGVLYGVLNTDGETIIDVEYQHIGLETNNYTENGVENQYILLDTIIPVKNNNLWGIFDIEGKQITDFKYTSVGSKKTDVANSYPVVVVPSYQVIIVEKDGFYNIIKKDGSELITSFVLDSVYLRTNASTGQNTYYMTFNGNTQNVEETLSKLGI